MAGPPGSGSRAWPGCFQHRAPWPCLDPNEKWSTSWRASLMGAREGWQQRWQQGCMVSLAAMSCQRLCAVAVAVHEKTRTDGLESDKLEHHEACFPARELDRAMRTTTQYGNGRVCG